MRMLSDSALGFRAVMRSEFGELLPRLPVVTLEFFCTRMKLIDFRDGNLVRYSLLEIETDSLFLQRTVTML